MAGPEGPSDEPVSNDRLVTIQPEAQDELEDAYRYYEDKSEGLGLDFLRVVEASFASMERYPEMYPVVYKNVRRAVLRRFPYSLFYILEPQRIVVIACFHASRNPKEWRKRA